MHPIEISESAGIRNLHFGSDWVQGAMRICRPHALVLEYTQVMMASLLLRDAGEQFKRWPRRALSTPSPTASITPKNSCPIVRGYFANGLWPR